MATAKTYTILLIPSVFWDMTELRLSPYMCYPPYSPNIILKIIVFIVEFSFLMQAETTITFDTFRILGVLLQRRSFEFLQIFIYVKTIRLWVVHVCLLGIAQVVSELPMQMEPVDKCAYTNFAGKLENGQGFLLLPFLCLLIRQRAPLDTELLRMPLDVC